MRPFHSSDVPPVPVTAPRARVLRSFIERVARLTGGGPGCGARLPARFLPDDFPVPEHHHLPAGRGPPAGVRVRRPGAARPRRRCGPGRPTAWPASGPARSRPAPFGRQHRDTAGLLSCHLPFVHQTSVRALEIAPSPRVNRRRIADSGGRRALHRATYCATRAIAIQAPATTGHQSYTVADVPHRGYGTRQPRPLSAEPTARTPIRIAASGIAPPPANGSSTRGARPPERRADLRPEPRELGRVLLAPRQDRRHPREPPPPLPGAGSNPARRTANAGAPARYAARLNGADRSGSAGTARRKRRDC